MRFLVKLWVYLESYVNTSNWYEIRQGENDTALSHHTFLSILDSCP